MQSQTDPSEDMGGNPPQETTTIGRAEDKGSQDGQAEDEAGRTHTKTETRRGSPETDSGLQSEHFSSELYRSKGLQELGEQGRIRLERHLSQDSAAKVSLGIQSQDLITLGIEEAKTTSFLARRRRRPGSITKRLTRRFLS